MQTAISKDGVEDVKPWASADGVQHRSKSSPGGKRGTATARGCPQNWPVLEEVCGALRGRVRTTTAG